jgi:WD40 repeat protein
MSQFCRSLCFLLGLASMSWAADPQTPKKAVSAPKVKASGSTGRDADALPAGAICRLGASRLLHGPGMRGLTFTLGGKALASWGYTTYPVGRNVEAELPGLLVRLWDPASGQQTSAFKIPRIISNPDYYRLMETGGKAFVVLGAAGAYAEENDVILWDFATGKELRKFGRIAPCTCGAFSADGKKLALGRKRQKQPTAGSKGGGYKTSAEKRTEPVTKPDQDLYLWEVETGKALPVPRVGEAGVSALALSADGASLAWAERNLIHLWDLGQAKELHRLTTAFPAVASLAFFPDGKRLLAQAGWNPGPLRGDRQPRPPDCPAFEVWNTFEGTRLPPFTDLPRGLGLLAFSTNGTKLAWGGIQRIRIWDTNTGQKPIFMENSPPFMVGICLSPDGKFLAGGTREGTIQVWDARTGKAADPREGHRGAVEAVTFSPDGKVATSGADGVTCLWSLPEGTEVARFKGKNPVAFGASALAFSQDGTELAEVGERYRLRRVANGELLRAFQWSAEIRSKNDSTLSADGKVAARFVLDSGAPGEVQVRNTSSWAVIGKVKIGDGEAAISLGSIGLSPDGKILALASVDGGFPNRASIYLGETAAGTLPLRGQIALSDQVAPVMTFSPDGKVLAAAVTEPQRTRDEVGNFVPASGSRMHLWDTATGRPIRDFGPEPQSREGTTTSLQFSPDGKTLAEGCNDGGVWLWDVSTGATSGHFQGPAEMVTSLAYDRRGRWLVSGSADSTALVWDLARANRPASKK